MQKKIPVLYNTLCCRNTYGQTSRGVLFLVLQILSNLYIIVSSCCRRLINATLYKNRHQIMSGKLLKDARKWYHFRITHYVAEILTNKRAVAYYFECYKYSQTFISLCHHAVVDNSKPPYTKINIK